jgi:hypothetical protein
MLKVKADLKAELLKPRYRDAFGPALSAVLIEQGLAAQLCNSLYEQEKKLEHDGCEVHVEAELWRTQDRDFSLPGEQASAHGSTCKQQQPQLKAVSSICCRSFPATVAAWARGCAYLQGGGRHECHALSNSCQ